MKSKKLEHGSKGVMAEHRLAGSCNESVATDGTQIEHGYGEGIFYKEAKKARNKERAGRSLEPRWGVERELQRCGLKASEDGKRRLGRRGFTGLSGREVGNFTGFYRLTTRCYRLFPHKSKQVVDFPYLAHVRLFWGNPEIGKTMDTHGGKPGMKGSMRADDKGEINHIYASRYIDFYACNSH